MRKKLLVFFIFFTFYGFSQQEITIQFIDTESQTPVEEVTVTALRTKESYISNELGIVKVHLERSTYLEINHSLYKKMVLRSIQLKDEVNVVYLENSINKLPEIILTKNHPQEILKSVVDNSKKRLTVPSNLKVYIREFFKKNETNILYNDGLINFQMLRDKTSVKSDILVEQNRVLGIFDENFEKEVYGYNLNDLIENYYQFKYLEEILENKQRDKYDFQLRSYPENENYYQILVRPLEEISGFLFSYSILYDHTKKIIVEIESSISPERAEANTNHSISNRKNVYKSAFKTTYRVRGSDYYLVYAKEEIGYAEKRHNQIERIEVRNYFVTTKFTTRLFSYDTKDIFKEKTLLNRKNTILTAFWNEDSGLILTQDEQDFIDSLSPPVELVED